jgi:hypothetical protein
MRFAHDCGRAFAPARRSGSARPYYLPSAILLAAAGIAIGACSDTPTQPQEAQEAVRVGALGATEAVSLVYPLVSILPQTTTLAVGGKVTLLAKLAASNGTTWMSKESLWKSSDTTVLSVTTANWDGVGGDEGVVTAKKAGKATITATTQSNTIGTLTITVTAPPAAVVYPLVTITPATTSLIVGKKLTLLAKLAAANGETWMGTETTWKSSDTTVLSVSTANWGILTGDQGIVTAKKAGTATITGTTESGTVGSIAITVGVAALSTTPVSSGSLHEPSGYLTVINTGALTSGPTRSNSSWSTGGPVPATWTVVQGTPPANVGLSSAGSDEPQSSGYRLYFPAGAQNDAAVAASLPFTPVGGGSIYGRYKIRLGSSWSLAAMNAQSSKLFAPKSVTSGNDDIIMAYLPSPSNFAAGVGLQGPTTVNVPNNNQATPSASDEFAAGVWTTVEVLMVADSPAGAGNGSVTVWVNGVLGGSATGVSIFSAGQTEQWRDWSVYASRAVYSGVQSVSTYEDVDQIYVSVSPE